jgi:hypothetical protein
VHAVAQEKECAPSRHGIALTSRQLRTQMHLSRPDLQCLHILETFETFHAEHYKCILERRSNNLLQRNIAFLERGRVRRRCWAAAAQRARRVGRLVVESTVDLKVLVSIRLQKIS